MLFFLKLSTFVASIIETPQFLLSTVCIALIIKIHITCRFLIHRLHRSAIKHLLLFLVLILIGSIIGDISWIIKLTRKLFFPKIPYTLLLWCIRIAFGFYIIHYQTLVLFIQGLTNKRFFLSRYQIITVVCSLGLATYFFAIAFFGHNFHDEQSRNTMFYEDTWNSSHLEIIIIRLVELYFLLALSLPTLYCVFKRLQKDLLPIILKKQIRILTYYLLIPYVIAEFLFGIQLMVSTPSLMYTLTSGATLLITAAIYFSIKKVLNIRFLNTHPQVTVPTSINFIKDTKAIIEHVMTAHTIDDVRRCTQLFFNEIFSINPRFCVFHVRGDSSDSTNNPHESYIERIIAHDPDFVTYLYNTKILLYDELEFSNFYQEDPLLEKAIKLLQTLQADILLPLFSKHHLIGYIIIARNARTDHLYSTIEQDNMLVFSIYASTTAHIITHRIFEQLLSQEKQLRTELQTKQLEINQYKESFRNLLKNKKAADIGIVFYKNKRFMLGNQAAHDLLGIKPSIQDTHPISKSLHQLVQRVSQYRSTVSDIVTNDQGMKLTLSAHTCDQQGSILITVSPPRMTDMIEQQLMRLQDPTQWDYLLYLETTPSGKLINQLIPGNGHTVLNFKIDLLKGALSHKALLLHVSEPDLVQTVELIHHLSLREQLVTITINNEQDALSSEIAIFGINDPLMGASKPPLLSQLHGNGTLFINHLELLSWHAQQRLAHFIQTGTYQSLKSDQRLTSNVRIICATKHSIQHLINEGIIIDQLAHQLTMTTLQFPSLQDLPEPELSELVDAFTLQTIKSQELQPFFQLTSSEKLQLTQTRPISLHELKNRIQEILLRKAQRTITTYDTQGGSLLDSVDDPFITHAIRMGKYALRNQETMTRLWNTFKNQNKIATLLGVNRSSVNRRCREYNLH